MRFLRFRRFFTRKFTKSNKKTFSDYEKGFLEGLIDGEGALMLGYQSDKRYFKPYLTVNNNSKELLEKYLVITGEGANVRVRPVKNMRIQQGFQKQIYVVVFNSATQIINILTQIQLTVKRKQQNLLLTACYLIRDKPSNMQVALLDLRKQIMIENKRGV